ncbi:MAG: hypothetical protein O3A00_27615 [Planctomycetota bacterium]|nr:hypothetical protein [Planctomycetota bacterium]
MPRVELTFEQISKAASGLSAEDRERLRSILIAESECIPKGDRARQAFDELRDSFRMEPKRERRMSHLLRKSGEKKLTLSERRELDDILDDVNNRMFDLADAVFQSGVRRNRNTG